MKKQIKNIISEEFISLLKEMIDPNGGDIYYPPGLDPKVVKLFENNTEDAEKVYQGSLDDDYWKKISKKFPDYNSLDSPDTDKAVNYILNGMKKKYPKYDWDKIEKLVRDKIHGGIT